MTQLLNNDSQVKKTKKSIETFMCFVGISLAIVVITVLESSTMEVWIKIIIGLIIGIATLLLTKSLTKYVQHFLERYKINLLSLYVGYIVLYLIIRVLIDR
ncbi:hypothetical protein [Jeotgalibacillus soli]|uniref:Uncharacterized protein n=1 Tax=Jeotgalibacillus soli TaxID=889306 RepID=A0A0C2RTY8_9BACL|nr:hypothetical protein [Jeotgalibacillus soli]KIL45214.1 hypothetical protein KP78_27580 [Jeotgalibacillus soli]